MPPISILIKPASSLCNMRCKYCFYEDVVENRDVKSYGMMTYETLEKLVRKALEYADGYCTFGFQGGEPTLVGLEFYQKLIEFQKKYNYKNVNILNAIQTNGYNISPQFARFLSLNKFLVGLSIDGSREIHDSLRIDSSGEGTYDQVTQTAKMFDKNNVEYNILCVVTNYIAKKPDVVYRSLRKYKYIQFIPCLDGFDCEKQDFSLEPDVYTSFLKGMFDYYYRDFMKGNYVSIRNFDNYISIVAGFHPENCAMSGVCSCYFCIEGDGSTYPCDFYVLDQWKLGNVNADSFPRMLNSNNAMEFVESSKYVDPECKTCKWQNLCRGGCRRNREPFVNGKPALNIYCESHKEFFEYSYDRMLEIVETVKRNQI